MVHGDPIRYAFYGSTGSTSQSIQLFVPGSNSTYSLLPTDFLYLDSFNGSAISATGTALANGFIGALLSAPAGQSTILQSTLMLPFGTAGTDWHSGHSEGMSGPQGVLPSVLGNPISANGSTANLAVAGTGFVVHAPGVTRPTFLNSQVPTG